MFKVLLRLLASLPLPLLHGLGAVTGSLMYILDHKFSRRVRDNLTRVGLATDAASLTHLARRCAVETGKGLLESFAIWFGPPASVRRRVQACHGWQHVEDALAQGRGIIFLTPHLGCFEITAQYYALHHPISVLFKPASQGWLADLIAQGRGRSQVRLAPTNLTGVRSLLKALRHGEAVGILPDQVPEAGDGVWADFFGQPAYTMTLVSKLQQSTGAQVLMAFGERLSWGRGYVIHITPLPGEASPDNINAGIERMVRQCPPQYLWSYRRFKQP